MNLFTISLKSAAVVATAVAALCSIAVQAQAAPDAVASTQAPRFVKWLALGDSITIHGPSEKLKWLAPTRGMAASTLENDYVHLLQKAIQAKEPGSVTDLKVSGRFAKLSNGTVETLAKDAADLAAGGSDLVTIQTGENDRLSEIGKEGFEARYRALVDALLSASKKPVIVCTGVWQPGAALDPADPTRYASGEGRVKDDIIQAICREKGMIFVPIAPAASIPTNQGAGEDPGVRWHPNDAGMKGYADAILAALYKK